MAKRQGYIPRKDQAFEAWQANFMTTIATLATTLNIPPVEMAALATEQGAWETAWAAGGKDFKESRTPPLTRAKTRIRKVYEKALRNFIKRWVTNNLAATEEQKLSLGVTIADTVRTRMPVPDTKPICFKKTNAEHLIVALEVRDENSPRSSKKPDNAVEYEVWGNLYLPGVAVPSPIPVGNFTYQKSSTRHDTKLTFADGSTGGTFAFRLRWKNSHGETGPSSDVYTIIIT